MIFIKLKTFTIKAFIAFSSASAGHHYTRNAPKKKRKYPVPSGHRFLCRSGALLVVPKCSAALEVYILYSIRVLVRSSVLIAGSIAHLSLINAIPVVVGRSSRFLATKSMSAPFALIRGLLAAIVNCRKVPTRLRLPTRLTLRFLSIYLPLPFIVPVMPSRDGVYFIL